MASEMKVEIIHKETIKPSSPTPHHLRYSDFSLFDQFAPEVYPAVVLFYTGTSSTDNLSSSVAERSNLLKSSLSETLTRFYPFAGRIELETSRICCNDNGAAFVEAHVSCPISKILDNSDPAMLKQLIATDTKSSLASIEYLFLVQANFFECGGIAIGVSISHKLSDAYTLSRFLNSWAAIACGSNLVVPPTDQYGAAASLFPPLDFSNSPPSGTEVVKAESRVTTRRFKFDGSKIAYLKSRAASDIVPRPSGVEAVSAFIWKCIMEASRLRLGFARPSVWCQLADMRKLLGQPSAAHTMGNMIGICAAKTENQAHHRANLKSLVAILRDGIKKFKVDYSKAGVVEICENYKEFGELMKRDDIDNYICSSWCKIPFYDVNFGWGKPTSVSSIEFKNVIVLIDTSDGAGIQASLTLEELDMAIVESKTELLAYASSNPMSKL